MSREQKGAWFMLAVFGTSLIAYGVLAVFIGPMPALGAFGLMGFTGLTPFIFRRRRDPSDVETDERDQMLQRKAALAAAIFSYEVFVIACMGLWFYYFMWRGQQLISVHYLAGVTLAGGIALMLVRSIAILVLYGRE
jgi:hypothetical protein